MEINFFEKNERTFGRITKTVRKFVCEMGYGIQGVQSVILTEIGRTLEEPISLKKTEERLSKQLSHEELEEKIGGRRDTLGSQRYIFIKEMSIILFFCCKTGCTEKIEGLLNAVHKYRKVLW